MFALGVLEPRSLEISGVENSVHGLHGRIVVLLEHDSFRPEVAQVAGDVVDREDHLSVAARFGLL